ncbi:MAG: bifunctional 4-hydroxy-2-oxoglutarate aldolase/2-dehydro-3-deoxy-phosphogluconate aldolase [candidate division KSB1 bacterium]|jgi:2-dehydro-3-deoxyphosphogluconate aldolase/(4S)-4-hydroxy-2-oxoglutarate aldolase|nr:bifunctional 4-hydroxy-2-oxoglutarate aldolase/2-dehydro-3-deoxy-phosphogluconate aldolase [candidate division KSB1 bacterium]
MRRQETLKKIEDAGVIAVIRLSDVKKLEKIIESLAKGGMNALEITMTTPGALDIMKELSQNNTSGFLIGAGTVLDPETARMAIVAGAEFVVGPVLNIDVIKMVHRYDKVVIPGAFTPTEILNAWDHGADVVKVFPATAGGPKYFKDVLGPLPQVKLTPTGGVSLNNAAEFIKAGACCLGVGSALLDKKMIAESDWDGLAGKAAAFIKAVEEGRQ